MVLAVGDILQDRYRIEGELDQGGMASVYKAWDARLELYVAVKQMIPQPMLGVRALIQLRSQFKREAQTLARLGHPSLVRVTDFFSQDDSEYLVMDFVQGESLGIRIERTGALPEAQVLKWAAQLLSALAYCHSQGVIHRDVKSHNVIIRPDEQAVLVDFGLVKLWDPSDPYTKTVMRGLGTPAFAPPEQFEALAEHTDERSDIYSLGATLYHALTGELPPTSPLRTANPERFVPLHTVAPQVSEQTAAVITKAMALPRSERWRSANEMAEALKIVTPTVLATERLLTDKDRKKRVPLWIGALAVAAVLLVAVGLAIGLGIREGRSTATPSPEGIAAVSPSVPATRTEATTRLPAGTSAAAPSLTPTVTSSPTLTATVSRPPARSPTPTATPDATPSRMMTPTPSPTLTRTPGPIEVTTLGTRTPTATLTPTIRPTVALPQLYAQPKLIEPRSHQVFGFDQQKMISLSWTPDSLADDHWYEVQLRRSEDGEPTVRYWTKGNWWDMGAEYYQEGDYYWQVIIVQGRDENVVGAVSPPSEMRHFQWLIRAPTPAPTATPTRTPIVPTSTLVPPTATPTQTPTTTPRPTQTPST